MKPMSAAYSRKQRRHRSRPYLRMIPWVLEHTRLPRAHNKVSTTTTKVALHPLGHTAQLCPTAMVMAAVYAIVSRNSG